MEGFSMSAQILDFKEAEKRREHHQLMKARYGAMLLAEMSLADEAADREARKHDAKRLAHIESYKKSNPNWTPENIEAVHRELDAWG
jgi:hypothetical protein